MKYKRNYIKKKAPWSSIENDHDANTKRSFYGNLMSIVFCLNSSVIEINPRPLKFQTNQKEMICGFKRENVTKFASMIDSYLP